MKRVLPFLLFLIAIPINGMADTIHVPVDQPTIQDGIDQATDGNTVLVAPGTYLEVINFLGKGITLLSEQGPEATEIDGLTLTNGQAPLFTYIEGLGIRCVDSSPTIQNNIIIDNSHIEGNWIYVYRG